MRRLLLALALLFTVSPALAQNYNATAGSGLVFGSKLITAVNYPQIVFCDPTTPAQCVAVNASGQLSLVANQSVNVAQINGVAPLMGNGVTGTGSQRVTISSDNTPVAGLGAGVNGSANPANSTQVGMSDGTNLQKWIAAIALADGVNGNNTGAVAEWLWNGTTYDRARGDLTNGLWANVKTSVLPTGAATSANQTSELTKLDSIITNTGAAIPAGTASIGAVGSDPSLGKGTPTFAFLAMPAATTTQIIALSGSTVTYVNSLMVFAGGTTNITFKTGTGSNCGTGTATLAGPYPLLAQVGFSQGAGTGAVMIVPAGKALCVTTDASVTGGVQLTYQQF